MVDKNIKMHCSKYIKRFWLPGIDHCIRDTPLGIYYSDVNKAKTMSLVGYPKIIPCIKFEHVWIIRF